MNADVEKAMERGDRFFSPDESAAMSNTDWKVIRQALRDQEAEIERLRNVSDGNAELYQHEVLRSESADALLRECHDAIGRRTDPEDDMDLAYRITAHLGGEQ